MASIKATRREFPERKRALVLPGGGGRGAYQVGVMKALVDSGLKFDMAYGTSIGALNAFLMAQDGLGKLEEIWRTLKPRDIFRYPSAQRLGEVFLGTKLGFLDTTPLEAVLRREADLKRLKESPLKVGLHTTDLCSLQTRFISVDEIKSTSELIDALMATSAVPIAFPPRQLHGQGLWVDGGLVKNTPLRAAIDEGAEEIFMVLLHPQKVSICPVNMWQVIARLVDVVLDASAQKELEVARMVEHMSLEARPESELAHRKLPRIEVIQPRQPVDINLLDIDPERSRMLIRAGYEDAVLHLDAVYPLQPQPVV